MSKLASKEYDVIRRRGYDLSDIRFLCRRTGLSNNKKIISLIEEDKDLSLVLGSIIDLPLIKRQTSRLSLRFLLLLLIHKYGGESLKYEHKHTIADIAANYFMLVVGGGEAKVDIDFTKPAKEGDAMLIFALNGLFGEYFIRFFDNESKYKTIRESHIKYIKNGLEKYEADQWVNEGLEILQKISEEGWIKRLYK